MSFGKGENCRLYDHSEMIINHVVRVFFDLIHASPNSQEIIRKSDLIFITTESKRVMNVIEELSKIGSNNINIIITSKGFAAKNGETFSEVIERKFPI